MFFITIRLLFIIRSKPSPRRTVCLCFDQRQKTTSFTTIGQFEIFILAYEVRPGRDTHLDVHRFEDKCTIKRSSLFICQSALDAPYDVKRDVFLKNTTPALRFIDDAPFAFHMLS